MYIAYFHFPSKIKVKKRKAKNICAMCSENRNIFQLYEVREKKVRYRRIEGFISPDPKGNFFFELDCSQELPI